MNICVIGLGGFSAFMEVDHFNRPGETVHALSVHYEAGGKGFNQAVAAARLGADVTFIQAAGDDNYKNLCIDTLRENNVTPVICTKNRQNTAFAVIQTDRSGENRVVVYPGAVLDTNDIIKNKKYIEQADYIILQNEVPHDVNRAVSDIAFENGKRIIYNPAPARLVDPGFLERMYITIPNEAEKASLGNDFAGNTITTMGKKGCMAVINGREYKCPVYGGAAVDSTGAGDTFTAAFTVADLSGKSIDEALLYASVASGLSVSKKYVMPSLPYKNDVDKIYNKLTEESNA